MKYDDFSLPPMEQLNKLNEEYQKKQKTFVQNFKEKENDVLMVEDELRLLANNCKNKFEKQKTFLQSIIKKTNSSILKLKLENLIKDNTFHFEKFKILYEEILPVYAQNNNDELISINKNYVLLIKDGIYNEVEIIKLLLELKTYETRVKLQSVIVNLINDRLDFIKNITSLTEEFLKPTTNSFNFFSKRF